MQALISLTHQTLGMVGRLIGYVWKAIKLLLLVELAVVAIWFAVLILRGIFAMLGFLAET